MKPCLCCGALCAPDAPHCPACGECSFGTAAEPPEASPPEAAPVVPPEPSADAEASTDPAPEAPPETAPTVPAKRGSGRAKSAPN
jgi:hypothetical protein